MKLLSAAIFKICFATYGLNDEEKLLTCFENYMNCSITTKTTAAPDPQKAALEKFKTCEGK
jgi:hypothetical protein